MESLAQNDRTTLSTERPMKSATRLGAVTRDTMKATGRATAQPMAEATTCSISSTRRPAVKFMPCLPTPRMKQAVS